MGRVGIFCVSPAQRGHEVCSLEYRRPNRGERPRISEVTDRQVLGQTDVMPIMKEAVVELEDEPQWNRRRRKPRKRGGPIPPGRDERDLKRDDAPKSGMTAPGAG